MLGRPARPGHQQRRLPGRRRPRLRLVPGRQRLQRPLHRAARTPHRADLRHRPRRPDADHRGQPHRGRPRDRTARHVGHRPARARPRRGLRGRLRLGARRHRTRRLSAAHNAADHADPDRHPDGHRAARPRRCGLRREPDGAGRAGRQPHHAARRRLSPPHPGRRRPGRLRPDAAGRLRRHHLHDGTHARGLGHPAVLGPVRVPVAGGRGRPRTVEGCTGSCSPRAGWWSACSSCWPCPSASSWAVGS
ncbi:hypothetical protein SCOCK_30330 [Actinacidiphila cocklensis]|uniref:Uncharacterized protein n=1 Tax=Actinacidiphila cocklensis TaxID=887465 RepID=A0A9W4E7X5_9ACTN|nr:hypothetical protein SCOCK_30330 [Actinacidiphila cocklensis]